MYNALAVRKVPGCLQSLAEILTPARRSGVPVVPSTIRPLMLGVPVGMGGRAGEAVRGLTPIPPLDRESKSHDPAITRDMSSLD